MNKRSYNRIEKLSPERRTEIARAGGIAASQDRARMAEIGRKGGHTTSQNREHMSEIGRKGGLNSRGYKASDKTD